MKITQPSGCRVAAIILCCFCLPRTTGSAVGQLESSYSYLLSERDSGRGILYTALSKDLNGLILPLSFYDSAAFWAKHVCRYPLPTCRVHDIYNSSDYSVKPAVGESGELQTERINIHNGTSIYDEATWQIAVTLGHAVNGYSSPGLKNVYGLIADVNASLAAHRAVTRQQTFIYSGSIVTNPTQAYSFRMFADHWLVADPFVGTAYQELISVDALPSFNKEYQPGKLSWTDWKPITGENAWAFLIGPLQAAYIQYFLNQKKNFVPLNDLAIQNALHIVPTFAAMQAPNGAVYYAPAGTLANQGTQLVSPHYVSVENNFSLLAGLRLLDRTLRATLSNDRTLAKHQIDGLRVALAAVAIMIEGGARSGQVHTNGLLSFLHKAAWHNGAFVQGGFANDPGQKQDWVPIPEPQAVDVETWGVAVLGAALVDQWFGFGASYKLWMRLKAWGGYGVNDRLWGVGYSDKDGNGLDELGRYRQGVMSTEWTAGAIDMVRNMLNYYAAVPTESANYRLARQYLAALDRDEASMLDGVQKLRFDSYLETDWPGKPEDYATLISGQTGSYLYASRRYFVPFGWNANPIPSTSSIAWMIMAADHYDPFGYGGRPN